MRFQETSLDSSLLRLRQEADDTQLRMRLGGIFYVFGWSFVMAAGGLREPWAWTIGAVLLLLTLFRFLSPVPDRATATKRDLRRWLRWPWLLILTSCGVWGGACAWVLSVPGYDPARTVVLFCCVAFSAASAHAFVMRRLFAISTLALLLGPPVFVLGVLRQETTLALAVLVYLGYASLAVERSHREWLQRLNLDIELRRQRDLFARLSRRDGLTGLSNRMHFDHVLREAVSTAQGRAESLTLMLVDLDHFKSINDRFGHSEGDSCLVAFAQQLQREFAEDSTLVARVGGEEFAVILRGVTVKEVCRRADRFRLATESQSATTALPITISIGVAAAAAGSEDSAERLYRDADMALYRAKSDGRNQVCMPDAPLRESRRRSTDVR